METVAPAPVPVSTPDRYDFSRPDRLTRDRMRTIGAIHERVMRAFEGWLYSRVRGQLEMELHHVEVVSFADFASHLPIPCAVYAFEILETGGQQGVIEVGTDFASLLVDRFFGGSGDPQKLDRPLTPIERLAVRLVVERLLSLVADGWRTYVPMSCALRSFESMPVMVRAVPKEEPVLVAVLRISVDGHASDVRIVLPLNVLGDFFAAREARRVSEMAGTDHERIASRALAESSIRATPVELAARLPEFQTAMRQLLSLSVGAVLPTGIPVTTPLEVAVGDQRRFHAVPGRIGPRLAIRLVDACASPLQPSES